MKWKNRIKERNNNDNNNKSARQVRLKARRLRKSRPNLALPVMHLAFTPFHSISDFIFLLAAQSNLSPFISHQVTYWCMGSLKRTRIFWGICTHTHSQPYTHSVHCVRGLEWGAKDVTYSLKTKECGACLGRVFLLRLMFFRVLSLSLSLPRSFVCLHVCLVCVSFLFAESILLRLESMENDQLDKDITLDF